MDLSKILSCKKVLKKNLKLNLGQEDIDYLENTYSDNRGLIETESITKIAEHRCVIREKVRIWFCNRKRRDRLECLSEWKRIKEKAKNIFSTSTRFSNYKSPILKECCTPQLQTFLLEEYQASLNLLNEIDQFSKKIPNLNVFAED